MPDSPENAKKMSIGLVIYSEWFLDGNIYVPVTCIGLFISKLATGFFQQVFDNSF